MRRASRGRRLVPGSEREVRGTGVLFMGFLGAALPLACWGDEVGLGAEVEIGGAGATVGPLGDAMVMSRRV